MKINLIVASATTLLASSAFAADKTEFDAITLSTSMGWLGGESGEYVYADDGSKTSALTWKIKNAPIIKGDLSWDATHWLTLGARGWVTLTSSDSQMDDYDWLTPGQSGWSDWSTHPDTQLNHANEFDAYVKGWLVKTPEYGLAAMLGYQQTRYSWTAYGGTYRYDNGQDVGAFVPGEAVGGYKQQFSVPYLGLAGVSRFGDVELSAMFKFSPWVRARDNDEHYQRAVTFHEKGINSDYYSATLAAGYYLNPSAKIYMEFNYSQYKTASADMTIIDRMMEDQQHLSGDVAGLSNKSYSLTTGLQYQF
ncbi:omptin family outer membrane protease [Erwinia psidii]|uniref:omptin family outer membrane protease n=1 Tax=Erwinia psidii TaxID=69224 RepID=UPI00226B8013|nr:omptin family outer membrane protease [Erwinia psidii]MCX8963700.1 omptin family outer membrane protease [Erwinia psidii]